MFKKVSTIIIVSGLILAGCATQGGWTPTVDPYGDPNAAAIGNNMAACKQLALQASGGTASEAVKGGLVGGAIGAAAGAALGAATGGDIGTGAAMGAVIGGMGAGVTQGVSAEQAYKQAYINCMRNRGHKVIN